MSKCCIICGIVKNGKREGYDMIVCAALSVGVAITTRPEGISNKGLCLQHRIAMLTGASHLLRSELPDDGPIDEDSYQSILKIVNGTK